MKKPQRRFKKTKLGQLEPILSLMAEMAVERIGLLIRVDDPKRFKYLFNQAKRHAADHEYDKLQARIVDLPDGNIAIVRGKSRGRPAATGSRDIPSLPRNPYERGADLSREAVEGSRWHGRQVDRVIDPSEPTQLQPRSAKRSALRELFLDDEGGCGDEPGEDVAEDTAQGESSGDLPE